MAGQIAIKKAANSPFAIEKAASCQFVIKTRPAAHSQRRFASKRLPAANLQTRRRPAASLRPRRWPAASLQTKRRPTFANKTAADSALLRRTHACTHARTHARARHSSHRPPLHTHTRPHAHRALLVAVTAGRGRPLILFYAHARRPLHHRPFTSKVFNISLTLAGSPKIAPNPKSETRNLNLTRKPKTHTT